MELRVICATASAALGRGVAAELGGAPVPVAVERFPDGELHVVVPAPLDGAEAVIVQSLREPVGESLLELALLADGCRRAGAARLTAAIPYFAYARQDRCKQRGEALGGEVLARLVSAARFERIIAVELHSDIATAWFGAPVEHWSALEALTEAARPALPPAAVVVSPDLGGVKRAERVARLLGAPLAVVHKSRRSATEVTVHRVLGDVRGRAPVIVDDMISTGGTIEAAVRALRAEGATEDVTVLATHALLAGEAVERLRAAGVRRLVHSDSLSPFGPVLFERVVVGLAPLLARALQKR